MVIMRRIHSANISGILLYMKTHDADGGARRELRENTHPHKEFTPTFGQESRHPKNRYPLLLSFTIF